MPTTRPDRPPARKERSHDPNTPTPLKKKKPALCKPRDRYTAVPDCLLREQSSFEDPNDFMIYLRFFALAFGFGRNTCDMGLAELGQFTRLCKNSVRRSIERLEKQGWIMKIVEFEPGQITRKWRVLSPWEKGIRPIIQK